LKSFSHNGTLHKHKQIHERGIKTKQTKGKVKSDDQQLQTNIQVDDNTLIDNNLVKNVSSSVLNGNSHKCSHFLENLATIETKRQAVAIGTADINNQNTNYSLVGKVESENQCLLQPLQNVNMGITSETYFTETGSNIQYVLVPTGQYQLPPSSVIPIQSAYQQIPQSINIATSEHDLNASSMTNGQTLTAYVVPISNNSTGSSHTQHSDMCETDLYTLGML
jgi:hypothetical protein